MSIILGIDAYHPDAAACLVIDGKLKAAVAEERLGSRWKHDASFPANSIRWCLDYAGIKLDDVTHVAVARDQSSNKAAKVEYVLRHPVASRSIVSTFLKRRKKLASLREQLVEICGSSMQNYHAQEVYVEHHLAHLASSYYLSPFDFAAGLTYDGAGDFAALLAARCQGNQIEVLDRVCLPHSLGFFYTALCQFIGFDGFGEEYKVMGLAPYGEDRFGKEMEQLLALPDNGWFRLNPRYLAMPRGYDESCMDEHGFIRLECLYTSRIQELFGPSRKRGEELTQRDKDIARSCQAHFEKAAIHCVNRLHGLVPERNLCMAGGCALNGVANARILRDTPFTTPYLQAASSDDGTCLGAAYWCYHNVVGGQERFWMKHAFWGPEYPETEIVSALQKHQLTAYRCMDNAELTDRAAQLIHQGNVVGWYQGRSEWGPRALGNRSILANPTIPTMKATINAKIKRRESFRPFAPSVLKEQVSTYFEQEVDSPFMMHVVRFKPEWRDKLPAVTHADGTGRLQSVEEANNPLYYMLIRRFMDYSGVGIVLNTSFNENEPVVDTPEQALNCYLRTDMDAICLGRYILTKNNVK